MTYPLAPNGIFWTIQGEGALLGEPMVFIRLAGCSVGCANCDTDYRVSRRANVEDLLKEIQAAVPESFKATKPWVWITGGEPTDHDLEPLVSVLKAINFRVALATAGIKAIPPGLVDWISVSPHSTNILQKYGHELKVCVGLNALPWNAIDEIDRWRSFPYRYIQPLGGEGGMDMWTLRKCVAFIKSHPGWRLGIQAHRYWQVP